MANEIARKLRKSMTRQEVKLWVKLRELRAIGHHFRRQSPLANYIVDFECRQSRLVIEVDAISMASTTIGGVTRFETKS
jgi:very-short-patch-repair endonuclease